ncbi:MAG: penicillin-binding protein 2 [Rudaea sp.]
MFRRKRILPSRPVEEAGEEEVVNPKTIAFIRIFGVFAALAFLLLAYQLYQIQIVQGKYFSSAGEAQRFRLLSTDAPRGVIYDRNGTILVHNEATFKVSITPADLPEGLQEEVLKNLSALIDVPLETQIESDAPDALGMLASDVSRSYVSATRKPGLVELVDQGRVVDPYTPVLIKSDVPRPIAFMIQEKAREFAGVKVEIDPVRDYPEGDLLGQLLGYVGHVPREVYERYKSRGYLPTDMVGLAGLEYTYEDQLRGQPGQRHVEVDVTGTEVRLLGEDKPQPGNNLFLTIDLDLQKATRDALLKGMQARNAKQGVAIAIDPNNGEILAMVSLPSYDNNLFAHGIKLPQYQALSQDESRPLVNHAISGQYPPGSTFKLVAASGALQEGIIDDKTALSDPGVIYVPNKYFPDDPRLAQPFVCWLKSGHGALPIRDAIAQSCDVFFYKLVGGFTDFTTPLGQALESDYARQFGFGATSGIDLPGEASGLIPDPKWKRDTWNEQWVTGDTYNMAIGQGFVLSTPLQVLDMTTIVANGGTLYQPHLARQIVNATGTLTNTIQPTAIRHLQIDDKYLQIVRDGMRGAVTHGTAWKVNLPGIEVAGKTGTAEYYGERNNGKLPTHAWFTAFAPFDKPKIAVVVFVAGGGEGSEVAAPIAAQMLRAYFHIPPDAPLEKPSAPPPPPEIRESLPSVPPAPAQGSKRFVGRVAGVQDAGDHERPVIDGTVVDSAGSPVPGATVTIDLGDGNAVMTTTTGPDGTFHFVDVDFHKGARWYIRMTTPVNTAVAALDIQPYKRYTVEFSAQ